MQARRKRLLKILIVYCTLVLLASVAVYEYSDPFRYSVNQMLGLCEIKERDIPAVPKEFYRVALDIYVIGSPSHHVDWSDEDIQNFVSGANDIWKPYGIELYVFDGIKRPSVNLSDNEVLLGISGDLTKDELELGKKIVGEKLFSTNFNVTKVFLISSFYNRTTYLELFGIRLFLGEFIIFGQRINAPNVDGTFIARDKNMTWTLAHELAHVFNLENNDIPENSGRFNLMVGSGCMKEQYYPTVINEEQYRNLLNKIPSIRHTKVNQGN